MPEKPISAREKDFAQLLEEVGLGPIEAYRKIFNHRCEEKQSQQRARDLARSVRVQDYREELRQSLNNQKEAHKILSESGAIDLDRLRDFAYQKLVDIRDDTQVKSATRFQAVKALKTLHDPAKDASLILRWIDVAWRYQKAHCPSCHNSFPLYKIKNQKLEEFRQVVELQHKDTAEEDYERRFELIKIADKRLRPHKSQRKALEADERHVIGMAPARVGKSYLMAIFGLLAFLIPGVEIWIIARIYENAKHEVNYFRKFLKSLFHPYYDYMVKEVEDKKSGELTFYSKWGSELKVKSAKAKGSIVGSELELCLIAEPGWVDGELYEEIRARMSSRLGRIVALGTPKGNTGIIGRMVRTTGRDPTTGRIVRRSPEERLVSNGCPWNISMLVYHLNPKDNPGYVQSELGAARMELTDSEYASEFEGLIDQIDGSKFVVRDRQLTQMPREFFSNAVFCLGVDQGPKNFGACLTAWDGKTAVPCYEFFNGDEAVTMRTNLMKLYKLVPDWIRKVGGDPNNWQLTITDRDPLLDGIFEEMKHEGRKWPTDIVLRHRNNYRLNENWRRELQEFINHLSKQGRLIFHQAHDMALDTDVSPGTSLLFDQVQNAIDVPEDPERESKADNKKGWIVHDAWRGDHVLDSFMFTMWLIFTQELKPVEAGMETSLNAWEEAEAAFKYRLARDEQRELTGGRIDPRDRVKPEDYFHRKFPRPMLMGGHYGDEA